jgi:hypothetical protein
LGECLLGAFFPKLNNEPKTQKCGLLFPWCKLGQKLGLATFWAILPQTHLVTLPFFKLILYFFSSGHSRQRHISQMECSQVRFQAFAQLSVDQSEEMSS